MNKEKLKAESQYLMPKKLITRLSGFMMSARMGKATTYMIKKFAKHYNINVSEAEKPLEDYKTFNEFFARELKKNARPLDTGEKSAVFPADGKISELGNIKDDLLIQAKNHYYTTEALLADEDDAKTFENGKFIFEFDMTDSDIVYGLGEAPRGINKRGWMYESFCSDDPFHTETKSSLYAAHNFLMLSGSDNFGLFIDFPARIRWDIGYTWKPET